ncbi:MAG: hypothetical protein JXR48_17170 [Candidatus Delongbacteria bacterium]|nr:hypothetical protein [Candidatus Delongbacteria bacterium]MBN2836690.1 hypothetical protein [Candidatus Delongbacteria bacterium]
MGIKGVYTYRSVNFNNKGFRDYAILTFMLSVLKWNELNGEVIVFGDDFYEDFLNDYCLYKLPLSFINKFGESKSDPVFWAGVKIETIEFLDAPFCLLDHDLIVWQDIRRIISATEIRSLHYEHLPNPVYPDKSWFIDTYIPDIDWNSLPINTSFLSINNQIYKKKYTNLALTFIERYRGKPHHTIPMVFAEQRIAGSIFRHIKDLVLLNEKTIEKQNIITHLWGYKRALEKSPELELNFCKKIANYIFNTYYLKVPIIEKYL